LSLAFLGNASREWLLVGKVERLATEPQAPNQAAVALMVDPAQIVEEAAPLSNHTKKTAP